MSLIVAAISGTLINLLIACITSVDFWSEPANRTIPRIKVLFLNGVKLHLNFFSKLQSIICFEYYVIGVEIFNVDEIHDWLPPLLISHKDHILAQIYYTTMSNFEISRRFNLSLCTINFQNVKLTCLIFHLHWYGVHSGLSCIKFFDSFSWIYNFFGQNTTYIFIPFLCRFFQGPLYLCFFSLDSCRKEKNVSAKTTRSRQNLDQQSSFLWGQNRPVNQIVE